MNIDELKKILLEELESFNDITEEGDPQGRFESFEEFEAHRNAIEHVLRLISRKS